jgi:hypothetical protein
VLAPIAIAIMAVIVALMLAPVTSDGLVGRLQGCLIDVDKFRGRRGRHYGRFLRRQLLSRTGPDDRRGLGCAAGSTPREDTRVRAVREDKESHEYRQDQ